ncbi:MAG: aldo/keto reductase [Candidatus Solibacter usitatus]|nr:aldo/keto reductase [Candidatus Solibacter usitatus]
MQRRAFLTTGAGLAGLNAFPCHLLAGARKEASDIVTLGPRKIRLSRLAQGTGTNGGGGSSNQTKKLGLGGVGDLLKAGHDNGLTFWDSADQYGTHAHVKEGLRRVPRDKVVIMSKTHASTEAEMKADIDRFRREIGTDYIDILLLHCMMDGTWPERKKGAMEYISQLQEKGVVRTKGVSCHTLAALKTAARTPWVEVDLARLNPAGVAMDGPPAQVIPVLQEMKAAGKGIIGMKILGAGKLRDKADECLQFALAQDVLDCFTIGAESIAEMSDLLRKIPAASTRG